MSFFFFNVELDLSYPTAWSNPETLVIFILFCAEVTPDEKSAAGNILEGNKEVLIKRLRSVHDMRGLNTSSHYL